jgi:hypothetical protein
LLPFSFTATSNCEFYLKWSHSGYQDDNGNTLQSTQVLINGNPIDTDILVTINNGVVTDTQGLISNNIEYPIWLTSGDIVTIRVTQNTAGVHHDTFTNITAYAVARTSSPMTLTKQGGGSPSWSGIGTVDSHYVRAGSTAIENINTAQSIVFTIKKSGTFYYTATLSNYPDDNSSVVDLYKSNKLGLKGLVFNDRKESVLKSLSNIINTFPSPLSVKAAPRGLRSSNVASIFSTLKSGRNVTNQSRILGTRKLPAALPVIGGKRNTRKRKNKNKNK